MVPNFFTSYVFLDQAIHAKAVGPLSEKGCVGSWKRLNVENENGSYLLLKHGQHGNGERCKRSELAAPEQCNSIVRISAVCHATAWHRGISIYLKLLQQQHP